MWFPYTKKIMSRSGPRDYRPISLLSALGKVLEKMVANTFWRHLNQHSLLSPHHFFFRPGRYTSDFPLLLLSQKWQYTLDRGLDTLVGTLNIAGAFCLSVALRPYGETTGQGCRR